MVLDDVGSCALFTFGERGQNRILSRTPEPIAELQIILALELADTDFSEVRLVLRTDAGDYSSLGVQRMGRRLQVVLVLQKQVQRETRQPGFELTVEDEVGKSRWSYRWKRWRKAEH